MQICKQYTEISMPDSGYPSPRFAVARGPFGSV